MCKECFIHEVCNEHKCAGAGPWPVRDTLGRGTKGCVCGGWFRIWEMAHQVADSATRSEGFACGLSNQIRDSESWVSH